MLFISDINLQKAFVENSKINFIKEPLFSRNDVGLTYRQVSILDGSKLLKAEPNKDRKWRKFNMIEAVYNSIVQDLKGFGLSHEKIFNVWKAFYLTSYLHNKNNFTVAELAILSALNKVQVFVAIDNFGDVLFFDFQHSIVLSADLDGSIVFNLNHKINLLLEKIQEEPVFPEVENLLEASRGGLNNFQLQPKEEELLKIIRNEEYSTIRIKKRNGEIDLVSAEKINNSQLTPSSVMLLIKDKKFQDISIVKRDGKIVNLKLEEKYKL